jgi:hypothetical protein
VSIVNARRKITVTFEGTDSEGEGFLFKRELDASRIDPTGDNPRFYVMQVAAGIGKAGESIREAVEAVYGSPDADPVRLSTSRPPTL